MKYFAIEHSLDEKIMGNVEQVKKVIHHCNVNYDKDFIDKFPFMKIETTPILSNTVLHNNSKQTDLINSGGIGFTFGSLVISNKFKEILDEFNCYGIQFFPTYIIQKDISNHNYWQTHIYEFSYEYIDFSKTKVVFKDRDENRNVIKKNIEISNLEEFLIIAESLGYPKEISLVDIHFKTDINLDFFRIKYSDDSYGIVSERLKSELEKQQCTGIEFRPIELSYSEWSKSDGERQKVYGKSW
ncbi:imm11 family protein [Flavobacterium sp.]|uniref:imm11 family protein n=1 Tax=Flavobacterium sp. TaxID=239 RepID=UPI00286E00D9|nr:DUF1629 domain-containing protein [Flavobacterium sp.]